MKSSVLSGTDYIENIFPAVSKMHGYERCSYMAEMTIKYCEGKEAEGANTVRMEQEYRLRDVLKSKPSKKN
ncbi:MAG: hypothetical protein R2941_10765 [Desulfobacterales bacterium]